MVFVLVFCVQQFSRQTAMKETFNKNEKHE
jgi:hypothetical protein